MLLYGVFASVLAGFVLYGFSGRKSGEPLPEPAISVPTGFEPFTFDPSSFHGSFESGEPDFILTAYRDPESREMVESFFGEIAGSREIGAVILVNALEFNIPASLAFSLCWEESRYNPRAVNRANSNKTIDRGLFQLNSASFPDLGETDFFAPHTNSYYGLSHLRWCLDTGGTEVAGLAMYNAGTGRVRNGGTPKGTLDYVSRIINRQRKIDELFLEEYGKSVVEIAETPEITVEAPEFALSLLAPLGRR